MGWMMTAMITLALTGNYSAAFNAFMVGVTINIYEGRYRKMRHNGPDQGRRANDYEKPEIQSE